jgi:hypothetical protein
MFTGPKLKFTDSQLIALFTVMEHGNKYQQKDLACALGMARSNFSSEIVQPLLKTTSLKIDTLPKTKKRGRPGSILRVTDNPWILEDIYQSMNDRADRLKRDLQKYEAESLRHSDELFRDNFSKHVEWSRKATLFTLFLRDLGLKRPLPDDTKPDDCDKDFIEYLNVLDGCPPSQSL